MASEDLIANAHAVIDSPSDEVWDALVDPEKIGKYMFGTTVVSDWKKGSKIVWKGEWKGKSYEDKGVILEIEPGSRLQYTHFSPMSGEKDIPENYHIVTINLADKGAQTKISLTQDKNANEEAKKESEKNWAQMLTGLKKLLEEDR